MMLAVGMRTIGWNVNDGRARDCFDHVLSVSCERKKRWVKVRGWSLISGNCNLSEVRYDLAFEALTFTKWQVRLASFFDLGRSCFFITQMQSTCHSMKSEGPFRVKLHQS